MQVFKTYLVSGQITSDFSNRLGKTFDNASKITQQNSTGDFSSSRMNSGEQVSNSNSSTNSNSDQAGGRGGGDNTQAQDWKPRFPLSVLTEGDRVERILRHRSDFSEFGAIAFQGLKKGKLSEVTPQSDDIPTSVTRLPPFFQKLRPLKLRNIDPDECNYLHGRLDLELIEDPMEFPKVTMLGQDKNGDVTIIALYCEPAVLKQCFSLSKIGFGCKISIANPYAFGGREMIRVDEEDEIFFWDGKDDKKCRFCSKLDAPHKCARCKTASYCSKECQTHDWKVLKHKKVCDVYRKAYVN